MLEEHLPKKMGHTPVVDGKVRWESSMTNNPIKNPLARLLDHFLNVLLWFPPVAFLIVVGQKRAIAHVLGRPQLEHTACWWSGIMQRRCGERQ